MLLSSCLGVGHHPHMSSNRPMGTAVLESNVVDAVGPATSMAMVPWKLLQCHVAGKQPLKTHLIKAEAAPGVRPTRLTPPSPCCGHVGRGLQADPSATYVPFVKQHYYYRCLVKTHV